MSGRATGSASEQAAGPGASRMASVGAGVALLAAAVLTIVPFVWVVCASLKRPADFFTSMFLPRDESGIALSRFTGANFAMLFTQVDFARHLLNSIFLASVTGVLATLCCAMGGYALGRFKFKGDRLVTGVVIGAVLIPWPLLLAPGYELLFRLGLLDTFAGLILPAIAPAFGVFLFRQAVKSSVPTELVESARIDGCSEARLFGVIVLPLVKPMIGTFLMVTFLGVWNNFIGPQVVLQSPEKFPLAVAVAGLQGLYYQDYGVQMAGTVISVVPVLVLFLAMQGEFVSGLTSGAVKG
jgi:multiple sugar transport system permease protein